MKNEYDLTDNGINILLNEMEIDKAINIDMYFQLIEYKILSKELNLYLCMMKDNNGITYNKFLLMTSKKLKENEIIHLKKVRISISGTQKIISCLSYENIDYNNFLKKRRELKILKEKKEKEILEQELKKKKEEEINEKREEEKIKIKKIAENFRKERLEYA